MANGILEINAAYLQEMLLLPKGMRIEDMVTTPLDRMNGRLTIIINHESIPEVTEGAALPYIQVTYTNINGPVEFAGIDIIK